MEKPMALVKCRECNAEISSKAKVCPKCGAKPRRIGFWSLSFFILFLVFIVGKLFSPPDSQPASNTANSQLVTKQENTPEDMRNAKVALYSGAIKANSRDPKSIEWISIRGNQDGSIICFKYRGRNGFGGVNVENLVIANDKTSTVWNSHCHEEGVEEIDNSTKWAIDNLDKF